MALCSGCGNEIFSGKVCYKCGTRVGGFVNTNAPVDSGFQQHSQPQSHVQSQSQPTSWGQQSAPATSQQLQAGIGLPKSMSFSEAVKYCFANFANFNGRARRSEYWYFVLFGIIVYFATAIIAPALYAIAVLVLFIPTIAVAVRRLHDGGRSGWNLLWVLVPFGGLVVLVWLASEGQMTLNKYST